MRLSLSQKLSALAAAPAIREPVKQKLIRRYWQRRPEWHLDFGGVSAVFATDDFFSNYWFYGPQDIGEAYEPEVTELVIKLAKKSRFFADIGANLGYFAIVGAKANPDMRVVAIELDETLGSITLRNADLNGLTNVEVKSGAVGDGETIVAYQPHAYSFLSKVAAENIRMPRVELKTKSFRLDDVFGDDLPDLVKMDVDGAEIVALQNASRMLANPDLTLMLEVQTVETEEGPATASQCGKLLGGFDLYRIKNGLHSLTDLDGLPTNRPTAMILATHRPASFFGC